MEKEFISSISKTNFAEEGSVSSKCPSNIALIKYWGKKSNQIPMNPSLSFTLTNSYTKTTLSYKLKQDKKDFSVKVYLDEKINENFVPKIYSFFQKIEDYIPFLKDFEFEIHTHNSFPHSSGIASSASGMGALALCLLEMEQKFGADYADDFFLKKASFLARLGSGSAARSLYEGITVWGKSEEIKGSSDLFAIPYPHEIHQNFYQFQDTILLIDEGQKRVSSSKGHDLMNNHPYAMQRFVSANENLKKLIPILKEGNLTEFGKIVEHEALSLHAMMMTSEESFILMKPNTLAVIEKIWQYRQLTSSNLCFTLDAGANVHLLYPEKEKETVNRFIHNDLIKYCINGNCIEDFVEFK